jgi:hypothetical protein
MDPRRTQTLLFCVAAFGAFQIHAQNLLVNGNFSGGNTGFTTSYGFVSSGVSTTPGTYGIRTKARDFNPAYESFGDHTSGTGNMMLVDGHPTANQTVWVQTVTVQTNTVYTFAGRVTASDSANVPVLRFAINGIQIGSDFTVSTNAGQWQQFLATWNSGSQTSAAISIRDILTIDFGNDFALDDLTFTSGIASNPPVAASIYLAVEIGWNSVTDRLYQVQYSTVLNSNSWFDLGVPVPGNGTTNYVFDTMRGQPKKFYRVQILP